MKRLTIVLLGGLGVFVVLFVGIQFVPYRVTNPSGRNEPTWDSPRTRQHAVAACFDSHSNETSTTWFEDIAPLSWWITNHVDEGRSALNFSECTRGRGENEAAEQVRESSMPPNYYTWFGMHGDAKLSPSERQQLADGLRATLSGWRCGSGDD
jgi:hypothetical protein